MNSYFFVLSFFAAGLGLISAGPFSAVAMARLMGLGGFCELVFETSYIECGRARARPLPGGWGGHFRAPCGEPCPPRARRLGPPRAAKKKPHMNFLLAGPSPAPDAPPAWPWAGGRKIGPLPNALAPARLQPHVPQNLRIILRQPGVPHFDKGFLLASCSREVGGFSSGCIQIKSRISSFPFYFSHLQTKSRIGSFYFFIPFS